MGSLFVRADVAKRTGALDDRFGLGTDIGSAEEVDYALRMMRTGVAALYAPNLYVGHPVKPSKQVVYWRGNLAVLAKHVGAKPIMWWRLWLRAARGIKFVLGGKMSLPYWFVSLAKAVPFLPLWRSSLGRFLTGH
jgi:GT2 family glycosyltransferase